MLGLPTGAALRNGASLKWSDLLLALCWTLLLVGLAVLFLWAVGVWVPDD